MSRSRRPRIRFFFIGLIALVAVVPGWPLMAQSSADRYGCDEIDAYFTDVYWGTIATENDSEVIDTVMETDDLLTLRRTQQRDGAEALERWAKAMDEVPDRDIPLAVHDWHLAAVDGVSLTSNMLYTLADGGGALDVMMYSDSFDDVAAARESAWDDAERMCGETWTSHFLGDDSDSESTTSIDYSGIAFAPPPITLSAGTPVASHAAAEGEQPYVGAVLGDPNAPVTMVIYADFQCPFCRIFAADTQPKIIEDFVRSGQVKLEFREFPALGGPDLSSKDNESSQSAQAVLCAAEQDSYLDYHDELYANQRGENQGAFTTKRLKQFAKELDLDTDAFNTCLDSGRYEATIAQSKAEGQELGVTATPMFIINGSVTQMTDQGYDLLKKQIEAAIETAP